MEYQNLTQAEKVIITKALEAKKQADKAQENYKKAVAKAFNLVKENGKVCKGKEKLVYYSQAKDTLTVKADKLAQAYPEIFQELAEVKKGQGEHIKCYV